MHLDPVILSRLQFAWVIAWHILLPAFTVGLASFIAVLEGLRLATGRHVYVRISTFWIKIFSIAFAMGVVTGIIMPFQFGTNWSGYADATANVLSPLFAYEGLTAFFLVAASCSAANLCPPGPISSRHSWWRWARSFRPSGFWRQTAGCRRHRATRS